MVEVSWNLIGYCALGGLVGGLLVAIPYYVIGMRIINKRHRETLRRMGIDE
jgi:hypothetical protein